MYVGTTQITRLCVLYCDANFISFLELNLIIYKNLQINCIIVLSEIIYYDCIWG